MMYMLKFSKVAQEPTQTQICLPLYYWFMFKLHFHHQFYQFYLCFVRGAIPKRITKTSQKFTLIRYDLIANQIYTHSVVHSNEKIYEEDFNSR